MKTIKKKRKNGTHRVMIKPDTDTIVEQSHKKAVDINTIVAKIQQGGMAPIARGTPLYGDFTGVENYHAVQNKLIRTNNQFQELPAEIKKRFNQDPGELIEFLADPANQEEAQELGLLKPVITPVNTDVNLPASSEPQGEPISQGVELPPIEP